MPAIGGVLFRASAMRCTDSAEIGRPERAAVTVGPLSRAALARSARFQPRRAISRSSVSVRSTMPITRLSLRATG
jgi:hypothetical protein